ncbi:MAG: HD domain-containing protein [Candidatus Tyrphobacter sp.]
MRFVLLLCATLALVASVPSPPVAPATTATGIPLDAPWKVRIYELARTKFLHPAWGWQHSERNYDLALDLARGDNLHVDTDVLFAASFLHDMAAFMPCVDTHLEHGACAALQSPAILHADGFPVAKIPAVQAAERTHMYYMTPGSDPAAIVLHDADSLDFLGAIGAARMIALTGANAPSFAPAVRTLRSFLRDIPPRLVTHTARRIGAARAAELRAFLDALQRESRGGAAM